MTPRTYETSLEDLNSSYIRGELEPLGITHVRFVAEGGEGENHVSVWAYRDPNSAGGWDNLVINTNALPIWYESSPEDFDLTIEALGIELP